MACAMYVVREVCVVHGSMQIRKCVRVCGIGVSDCGTMNNRQQRHMDMHICCSALFVKFFLFLQNLLVST